MTDPVLSQLAALLRRVDPVPSHVIDDARAALSFAGIPDGCRVLEPIAGETVLVRAGARSFRFGDNDISLDVELRRLPRRLAMVGLVSPVEDIQVCYQGGGRSLVPDLAGFFRADDLPHGPVRIIVRESLATRWFWV